MSSAASSSTVAARVRSPDLHLDDGHADLFATRPPSVARPRPGIHAVRDDRPTCAQVVGSHRMGHGVSLSVHVQPGVPQRCSIESMRRYTAANERANSRAIVVLPTPGRPLSTVSMRSWPEFAWPWLDVIEWHVPTNALKVPLVPGHQHATGFTTGQRQQNIVRERLRHAANLEPLFSSHVG